MTATATEQPGHREPAPPPLDLVQAFVNSWDREGGIERFDSPAGLERWLREHGLIRRGERVTARDLREAIELREAIRQLLLEHNGMQAHKSARSTFSRYADSSALVAQLTRDGGVELEAARPGVAGAWARLIAAIAEASTADLWPRLKACRSDVCQWAFFDHSKNRSSHWCTMQICGAKAKMRRYRKRRRAA
jgi:predicted RNA-binding Zn ribbon-like protein